MTPTVSLGPRLDRERRLTHSIITVTLTGQARQVAGLARAHEMKRTRWPGSHRRTAPDGGLAQGRTA